VSTEAARPSLAGLTLAADPAAWRAAGFEVGDDGTASVGSVRVRLGAGGRRITSWSLRDLSSTTLDGLPTEASHAPVGQPAAAHPNGAERIDHVVAFSPDLERTIAALRAAGLDFRRLREGPTPAGAQRQAFFRVGEAILEVIENPPGTPAPEDPDAPARFYGLAFATADIDATARVLGPLLGEVRDAIQPGGRIATVRREAALGMPVAFMSI
jgi:catechol 2,3-dioxygenase-like lactoylglutathione lyase family enzyme